MADLSSILNDPNYVNANAATKAAIFDKFSAQDKNFTGANPETQQAIRVKFGLDVTPPTSTSFNPGEMLVNAPASLYRNTIGGLYEAVSSPLQTGKALLDVVAGGAYNAMPAPVQRSITALEQSYGNPEALQRAQNVASLVGQDYAKTYGTGQGFARTMEQDPFRVAGDVSMLLGGASAGARAANLGKVSNALSQASAVTNPMNALLKPAAAVISPTISPQIQMLMKEGVVPTAGQILGGGYKRAEEALSSVPIIGDFIKGAQGRAMADVNRVAFNRALTPIGEKLPQGVVGREAVQFVSEKLDDAYGKLLPKMTVVQDTPFQTAIASLKGMVQSGAIDPKAVNFFNNWMDNNVLNKFQGQNAITGETLKAIQGDLRETISRLSASTDADQRLIGTALKEAQDQVRQLVTRSNPQYAKELKAIDTGYANFKRVERAAASLGAEEGIFSPAQLQNAIKAMDKSKDKGQFAQGQALMQDLSESAKTALGNKVPDSGTPYRSMMAALAASGGAGVAGFPAIAASLVASPLLYSQAGQNMLANILTKRPDFANALAAQLNTSEKAKLAALMAAQAGQTQTPYRIDLTGMANK
jgi:hypothetical protein